MLAAQDAEEARPESIIRGLFPTHWRNKRFGEVDTAYSPFQHWQKIQGSGFLGRARVRGFLLCPSHLSALSARPSHVPLPTECKGLGGNRHANQFCRMTP